MMQQATTFEQSRSDQDIANEMILEVEDEDAYVLQEAEPEADVGDAPKTSVEVVELLLEELLHTVVREKIADNASSDFFSQDSFIQPQHLAPCSQDFSFFKAIEQTREDLTTDEEDESLEELSPPSQLLCSPSTSELGDFQGWPSSPATRAILQRTATGVTGVPRLATELFQSSTIGHRAVLITPGPGIQLCPLTQIHSSADESLASQEDFFLSQKGAPALKRRKTLLKDKDTEVMGNKQPFNDEAEDTDAYRSTGDEEEALPLTFHTKEDLIRKLQGIQHLPRGDEVSHCQSMQSNSVTGRGEEGEKQWVERPRMVALEKGVDRHRRGDVRGQDMENVVKKELPCKAKEEVEFDRKSSEDNKLNHATKEGDDEGFRQDSYENKNNHDLGKEGGGLTRSYQPLLLHRAPRLGLSRLQKPSGIHDITIIKDTSFNEGSDSDVSFIKEE